MFLDSRADQGGITPSFSGNSSDYTPQTEEERQAALWGRIQEEGVAAYMNRLNGEVYAAHCGGKIRFQTSKTFLDDIREIVDAARVVLRYGDETYKEQVERTLAYWRDVSESCDGFLDDVLGIKKKKAMAAKNDVPSLEHSL